MTYYLLEQFMPVKTVNNYFIVQNYQVRNEYNLNL